VSRVIVAALVLLQAGCAAPHYLYEKRSATPAQTDHDLEACRREGFRPSKFAVWPSNRYDWDVVNRCMERRGYRVQPPED
jgi:hypothetical protein